MATLIAVVFFGGCASSATVTPIEIERASDDRTPSGEIDEQASALKQRARVLAEVDRWKGTRYRYGGTGPRGFDCSGFVFRVFQDALGVSLPRTTRSQMKSGRPVGNGDLTFADLVFFYTPARTDHVGIYLGGGEFAHASSSSGVMISHLSEDYWRKSFRGARRPVNIAFDNDGTGASVAASEKSEPETESDFPDYIPTPSRIGW